MYTKVLNEDYFKDIELSDDDIQSNDEQYHETNINDYPYYMILQIITTDNSQISFIDKSFIKKFSTQCHYVLDNMPDTVKVSEPRYYKYHFEYEIENDIDIISNEHRLNIVFGLDIQFFNFKHLWSLLSFLFNYKHNNAEIYRVIFNDQITDDIHSNVVFFDQWMFRNYNNLTSGAFKYFTDMLEFLKIKYDYEELYQKCYQPLHKTFKNYLGVPGKKLTMIEGGDIKPSLITQDNLPQKLHTLIAVNSLDITKIGEICSTCGGFEDADINDKVKQHINDDSNGNIGKCYFVVLTNKHHFYSADFIIYFTKTCSFFKNYVSDKYPPHYIITIKFPLNSINNSTTMAYNLYSFEKLGIDSDKFMNDIFTHIPLKLLREDQIKQEIKDKIQLLRYGEEIV